MNEATLRKLKMNPFYKMSDKQKKEIREQDLEDDSERRPIVEFGTPRLHQNHSSKQFATHNPNVVKKGRKNKNA